MVEMEEKKRWNKIISALITPMHADQSVNYDALKEIVECQLEDGVEGFYCCGSSGEGLLLTKEERKKVLETVLDQTNGRVPVISHVGTIRTADVIELAQHAKEKGAAAISMIPPYYYHFTMDEIMAYYEEVMNAVIGIPVIIYNIPQFTGVEFSKKNAGRLLKNPAILGIKHTSQDLYSMERIHKAYPEKLIFNGFDEQYLGALSMGAEATVGTTVNLYAPDFLKVRALYEQGKMKQALAVQQEINRKVEVMVSVGIFNAVKYAWTLRGIECGSCRSPFRQLMENEKEILRQQL